MKKVLIENDVFDISDRLKGIDEGYYVMYDTVLKRYEVHNKNAAVSLQLVLPYPCLDSRAIDKVYMTMVSRSQEIWEEIERHNERLEASKIGTISDELKFKTKELVQYLDRGGKELPSYSRL